MIKGRDIKFADIISPPAKQDGILRYSEEAGLFRLRGLGIRGGRFHQLRTVEQAAEFLFGEHMVSPFFGLQIAHLLIGDFKTLEPDNAQVFLALFPHLVLLQPHAGNCAMNPPLTSLTVQDPA
ncbi:hypothetical protein [Haloferula sp. BvORR071]|uniref:hypothetical protein n=1 Tax=Haloferula sp. BvORR071 TaxID=1396141 RepID=UPI0005555F3D|nr:hypothetical protein [Haloferula sp. BvORR071]